MIDAILDSPILANALTEDLKSQADLEYSIPLSMNPSTIICCSYSTRKPIMLTLDDERYLEVHSFFGDFLRVLHNRYGLTHVFTDPLLMYAPSKNEWTLKIAMMSQKEFEEINEILEKREQ